MVSDNANDSSGGAQKANGKGASGGSGEEAELMDFAFPASMVLEDEDVASLKRAVTEKLEELMDEPCDEVFPEYITVMVSNGKTIREICSQLEDLLTAATAIKFCKWLGVHLQGLEGKKRNASAAEQTKPTSKGKSKAEPSSSSPSKGGKPKGEKGGDSKANSSSNSKKGRSSKGGSDDEKTGSRKAAAGHTSPGRTSKPKGRDRSRKRSPSRSSSSRGRGRGRRSRSRSGSDRSVSDRSSSDRSSSNRSRGRSRSRDGSRGRWDRARGGSREGRRGWTRDRSRDSRDRNRPRQHSYGDMVASRDRSRDRTNGSGSYAARARNRSPYNARNGRGRYGADRGYGEGGGGSRDYYSRGGGEGGKGRWGRGESRHREDGRRDREERSREVLPPAGGSEGAGRRSDGGGVREERGEGGRDKDGRATPASGKSDDKPTADVKPRVTTVPGSVIKVVGSEGTEEASQEAKLPDLRTVIERSRRRVKPSQQGSMKEGSRDVEGRGGTGRATGAMRGFSPDSSMANGTGVKRGLSEEAAQSQQQEQGLDEEEQRKAFSRGPGVRLLSSAVMQSVQPARISKLDEGGRKRRKSGGEDVGDMFAGYDNTAHSAGNGTTFEYTTEEQNLHRAPAQGARLRITASEFRPHDGGAAGARTVASGQPSSQNNQASQSGADNNHQHQHEYSRQSWQGASDATAGVGVASAGSKTIWGRLGPRADESALTRSQSGDIGGGTQQWSEWGEQSMAGAVQGPQPSVSAAALRVAATGVAGDGGGGVSGPDYGLHSNNNNGSGVVYQTGAAGQSAPLVASSLNKTAAAIQQQQQQQQQYDVSSGGARGGRGGGGRFGRGGRNQTWVREGLREAGRGRGAETASAVVSPAAAESSPWETAGGRGVSFGRGRGRGFRGGGRAVRGRGVPGRSLGKGGGWHSTGSVGASAGAARGRGRGRGRGSAAAPARETWNKVWVRKDLVAENNGVGGSGVGDGQQQQQQQAESS